MFTVSPELATLAKFLVAARYEDLPQPVVHETERLIMDSIGCALSGITSDPGKMIIALAKRLGGPPESSIIGVSGKISSSGAALANGQLINTLDYDAVMAGGHAPPYVVPPPLAIAEYTGASGKDLILATALAVEVSARVGNAARGPVGGGFRWAPRAGYANCNFGAAAGAGKLLNLDQDKMAHALGIAGYLCEVLPWVRFSFSQNRHMTKYGMPGWQNTGAIQAVLLAEMGYHGDTTLFDSPHSFAEFAGYEGWQPQKITEGLGKMWAIANTPYKPYASCGVLHNAIDCFSRIISQNNLKPEDIESVRTYLPQTTEAPCFTSRDLNNIVDVQFGVHNLLAMVAYGIRTGVDWYDWGTITDPKIVAFAEKVSLQVNPPIEDKPSGTRVEVVAGGKTFREEQARARRGFGAESQMTDAELVDKYRHNASRILTQDKIDKSVASLMGLEKVENVRSLMAQVTM